MKELQLELKHIDERMEAMEIYHRRENDIGDFRESEYTRSGEEAEK